MPLHRFSRLFRLHVTDPSVTVHHIWRGGMDYHNPRMGRWEWSTRLSYYVLAESPPSGWAYLFQFTDGTMGTCQVSRVNAALAALGWQVDRRGDADRD